jgi:hypothetical protein
MPGLGIFIEEARTIIFIGRTNLRVALMIKEILLRAAKIMIFYD